MARSKRCVVWAFIVSAALSVPSASQRPRRLTGEGFGKEACAGKVPVPMTSLPVLLLLLLLLLPRAAPSG